MSQPYGSWDPRFLAGINLSYFAHSNTHRALREQSQKVTERGLDVQSLQKHRGLGWVVSLGWKSLFGACLEPLDAPTGTQLRRVGAGDRKQRKWHCIRYEAPARGSGPGQVADGDRLSPNPNPNQAILLSRQNTLPPGGWGEGGYGLVGGLAPNSGILGPRGGGEGAFFGSWVCEGF